MTETQIPETVSRPELWVAIRDARLPGQISPKTWYSKAEDLSFQDRLRQVHSFTEESARRLEFEYRRYLYLKALDGGTLTPSKRVDEAWHLHLSSANGAWEIFCATVIGRQIEHRAGLTRIEAKASYRRTIELYVQEFGKAGPIDIWPNEVAKLRLNIGQWLSLFGFTLPFIGGIVALGHNMAGTEPLTPETKELLWLLFGGCPVLLLFLGSMISANVDLETEANCG